MCMFRQRFDPLPVVTDIQNFHSILTRLSSVHRKNFSLLAAVKVPQIDTQKWHFFANGHDRTPTLRSILTHFQLTNLDKIHTGCSPVCGLCSYQKSASWCTNWQNAGCFPTASFYTNVPAQIGNFDSTFDRLSLLQNSQNLHITEIWQWAMYPPNIKWISLEMTEHRMFIFDSTFSWMCVTEYPTLSSILTRFYSTNLSEIFTQARYTCLVVTYQKWGWYLEK